MQESRFADNTIVVYTSDHGDMLGAHGGMHQKWHQAYEETTRVPMMISGPGIPEGESLELTTSHVDVIPTLLGLAGITSDDGGGLDEIYESLSESHTEAQTLPGRDLTEILYGNSDEDLPVYFITEDEITEGPNQEGSYEAVIEPAKVEAVIMRLETTVDGTTYNKLWKLARSYEDSLIHPPDDDEATGNEEFELYDLDDDPFEVINLAYYSTELGDAALPVMKLMLAAQREEKLRSPAGYSTTIRDFDFAVE